MTRYEYKNGLVKSVLLTLLTSVVELAVLFLIFWGIGHLLGRQSTEAFTRVLPYGCIAMLLWGGFLLFYNPCRERFGVSVGVHLMTLAVAMPLTVGAIVFCGEMLALGRGIPLAFIILFGGMLLSLWAIYMGTIYKPIRGEKEVWIPSSYNYDY